MPVPAPSSVLITGATRGIGRALALAYAAPGVELILHGRNAAGPEEVAAHCRERGAGVQCRMCDETPGPKPFLITADRAAAILRSRLRRNPARISFPFPLNAGNWCLGALPPDLSRRVLVGTGYGP